MSVPKFRNQLLLGLSAADRTLLSNSLTPVELQLRKLLEPANASIGQIYFPESGVISVVSKSADEQIEVGLVGREGMTGVAVVLASHRSPNEASVHIPGDAFRISADKLRECLDISTTLRQHFMRYAQVFFVQVAHTALVNGLGQVDVRLARWLLMAHDRYDFNELPVTHGSIAEVLGVRRPSVTEALQVLEGKGLIKTGRGVVGVVRRKGLIAAAGKFYGTPESEYARLLS